MEDESDIDLDEEDVEFDDEEFSKEFGDIDVDEDLCEEDFIDLGNYFTLDGIIPFIMIRVHILCINLRKLLNNDSDILQVKS